jgi:hypothetical protein
LLCAAERLSTSRTTVSSGEERVDLVDGVEARAHRAGSEHVVDEGGHLVGEGDVRGIQGVPAPTDPSAVDHAEVVEVGEGDPPHLDEGASVRRAGREEDAVDHFDELHEARGDVTDVDDPVVGKHGGVPAGVVEECGVLPEHLEARGCLDGSPERLLEVRAQGWWQVVVEHRPPVCLLHPRTLPAGLAGCNDGAAGRRRAWCGMPAW